MKLTEKHWKAAEQMLPQNAEKLLLNGQFRPWFLPGDKLVFRKESWVKKEKVIRYMLVDCKTGVQRELLDIKKLMSRLKRLGKEPAEGKTLDITPLYVLETGAVGFLHSDGTEYLFDGQRLQRLHKAPPYGFSLNPSRRWAAATRRNNLHIYDLKNGIASRVTKDGGNYNAYAARIEGDTYFLRHRLEEHVEPVGVEWAPHGSRFLTYRLDQRKVEPLPLVQQVPKEGMRPVLHEIRYTLPGETAPLCYFYVGDAKNGAVRRVQCDPVELPFLQPTLNGYGMLGWSQEGNLGACWRMSRDHKRVEMLLIDPDTGGTKRLFTEESDTFLFFDFHRLVASHRDVRGRDGLPLFILSEKLHSLFWLSERDGYMHIYQYDTERDGEHRQLTKGDFVVHQLLHLDAEGEKLYFTASGREANTRPYQRYLYVVDLQSGEMTLLSRVKGDHCIYFSPDGKYYTDTVSACDEPQATTLHTVGKDEEEPVQLCACDDSLLVKAGLTYPIFFTEKGADGVTDVTGVLIMPAHFDAEKKYPVVDYYYGGNQTINQPCTFYDYLQAGFTPSLSQLECVCVIIDGRGTPLRGRKYHQYCYRNMGDCAGMEDHVAVIRRLCEKYSFMDADHIGVWGHSGGGFGAFHCMTQHPEVYKVGVASGGNHYQELYNAEWSERFMGGYDAEALAAQSAGALAGKLEGKLLLIHGELDDNVHPANTLRIVDELIKADKDFDFLLIPNKHHQLSDMPYYQRRVLQYLAENLHGRR